eukprot:TRINITY_DN1911_c0_g1_i4.p1 TRINITY_DN1911_c0_g1~~TRINITY_DN1911_c0_g1_i4.p1  ORF type:complete len:434 (-),score=106.64 TRINITY_DN1911_c0_g1_i4:89-1342(-)
MPSWGRRLLAFRTAEEMWRPDAALSAPRSAPRKVQLFCALAAAALVAVWSWGGEGDAFVQGIGPERPAGSTVVVEKLPRGLTCMNSGATMRKPIAYRRKRNSEWDDAKPAVILPYGSEEREEWDPIPQWRGEKTYHPSKELQNDDHRQWFHFDAEGKTLGHLAQAIATTLRGKWNPLWDPTRDVGAYAIVTNCERVRVTGKKYYYKLYLRNHVMKPGHMKVERFKDVLQRFPERIIMRAVWGNMPRRKSSKRIFKERLKLFAGPNHLYYNKDPVPYPMHFVKTCKYHSNLRQRDRLYYRLTKGAEREKQMAEFKKSREDEKLLKRYKAFLARELVASEDEADKEMPVQDFYEKVQLEQQEKTYYDTLGQEVEKKIRVHWKNYLPKFRYSANKAQKRDPPLIDKIDSDGTLGPNGPKK